MNADAAADRPTKPGRKKASKQELGVTFALSLSVLLLIFGFFIQSAIKISELSVIETAMERIKDDGSRR